METSARLRERSNLTHTPFQWCFALLLVTSLLGCGGAVGSAPSQPPPSNISVTVTPTAAALLLGESQAFTATVRNTTNTAVTWSVNGLPGGTAAVGTVGTGGVYVAPQILSSPAQVSLVATSAADPSKSASASITLTSSFTLSISGPSSINAGMGGKYTAALSPAPNSNPSRVIFWSVQGSGCSGAACGTISSGGDYVAPSVAPTPAVVQIVATPEADRSSPASLDVSILPVISVMILPSSATVALGGMQAFQAVVTGAQDRTVTWDVDGVVGGNAILGTVQNSQTDPNHTTYAAPQSPPGNGSVTVRARSNADPAAFASAAVSFTGAISIRLTPASATLAIAHRETFTVHVDNSADQNVTWKVGPVSGGNSALGQICAPGSDPCQSVSVSSGPSVDYLAPTAVPSPNPVTIVATSQADGTRTASSSITILPHIVVSVLPVSASIAGTGQQRFSASVTGTGNQQVIWSITGPACAISGVCGAIDSNGLYTAPAGPPAPDQIDVVATSLEDESQSGSAQVTITSGPDIFSLAPASAYAGTSGGFTLLVSGGNFSSSSPGPGSTILVGGSPRTTTCASSSACASSLSAADLASPANLSVQVQNADGSLSNIQTFVVLARGSAALPIPVTPSAPESPGNDIVVVELSTNGGSGALANISLNIAAVGPYSVATSGCTLGGNPVVIARPVQGSGPADLCIFSVSGLQPSFVYTISEPPAPDILFTNREPLGLGIVHLALEVPATASPGPRSLFVENPEGDKAAATGALEVH